MTDPATHSSGNPDRRRLVAKAVAQWREELVDPGPCHPLLNVRPSPGTDLTGAARNGLDRLLAGETVTADRLYPSGGDEANAAWRNLHLDVEDHFAEHGVRTGYLVLGVAAWTEPRHTMAAPVLLCPIEIGPVPGGTGEFRITMDDAPIVNPVLIEYLAARHGVPVSPDRFPVPRNAKPVAILERVISQLRQAAGTSVPGFGIDADRRMLGRFDPSSAPLASDLDAAPELFAGHHVIAGLAGDGTGPRPAAPAPRTGAALDDLPPSEDLTVLDADGPQRAAIIAAAAGTVCVTGPPGTGKTQTIANLIATGIANGERVLFVAAKRSSIDTVTARLHRVGLDDLVLDAHDGPRAEDRIVETWKSLWDNHTEQPAPDTSGTDRELAESRDRLRAEYAATHDRWEPWRLSRFALRGMSAASGPAGRVEARIGPDCLDRLTPPVRERLADRIEAHAEAGGFDLTDVDTPWRTATLTDDADASRALAVANLLARTAPTVGATLAELAEQAGWRPARTLHGWDELLGFLTQVWATEQTWGHQVWTDPLQTWIEVTAPARWRRKYGVTHSWRDRRRALRQLRERRHGDFDVHRVHEELVAAGDQLARWRVLALTGDTPFIPSALDNAASGLSNFRSMLDELLARFDGLDVADWPFDRLTDWLDRLVADQTEPARMARLRRERAELDAAGLAPLLAELTVRRAGAAVARSAFLACFADSVLERLDAQKPSTVDSTASSDDVRRFIDADRAHVEANPRRVRHAAVRRLADARRNRPEAERFLTRQWGLRRNRAPVSRLLTEAGELLTALTPCLAVSPDLVPRLLPAQRMFDLLIIDESSRLAVSRVVPAIGRAGRVAVFGDVRQLPPDRPSGDDPAPGSPQSIMGAMSTTAPNLALTRHYRSRDPRLIRFADHRVYRDSLSGFPSRTDTGALEHVQVTGDGTAVIDRVVDLVAAHVRRHPSRSLGVVTADPGTARRIRDAIERAAAGRRDLAGLSRSGVAEPFFVKPAGHAQGDERDAVIVAVDAADGGFSGPAGAPALLVATTRSRRSTTIVSSVTDTDLADVPGDLLRPYLRYAADGGREPHDPGPAALTRFEIDLTDRLTGAGIPVTARYGAGRFRVDLAVPHPRRQRGPVLAIETDPDDRDEPVRDRERLRPSHLDCLGWMVHRIRSENWWRDPDTEIAAVAEAYRVAVRRADNGSARPPAQRTPAEPPRPSEPATGERGPCPVPPRRGAITDYSHDELVSVIAWVGDGGHDRSDDELRRSAMTALGFKRRGSRIDAALGEALAEWRRHTARS